MNLHFIQLNATSARLACVVNVVSVLSARLCRPQPAV